MALTKARSRMIGNSPINVLDFMTSAQITDVTSKTGSVDVSAAVQAAINSAETPDSAIYFPQGTYLFNSELLLVSESRFYGDGIGATTIKAGDNFELSGRVFDTFRRDNITIEGMMFDGNISGQTGYVPALDNGVSAIIIRSSKNITIRNCYFKDFGKDGVLAFETSPSQNK
jgi:polygalacturonase